MASLRTYDNGKYVSGDWRNVKFKYMQTSPALSARWLILSTYRIHREDLSKFTQLLAQKKLERDENVKNNVFQFLFPPLFGRL